MWGARGKCSTLSAECTWACCHLHALHILCLRPEQADLVHLQPASAAGSLLSTPSLGLHCCLENSDKWLHSCQAPSSPRCLANAGVLGGIWAYAEQVTEQAIGPRKKLQRFVTCQTAEEEPSAHHTLRPVGGHPQAPDSDAASYGRSAACLSEAEG